jgi:hypothetical protein
MGAGRRSGGRRYSKDVHSGSKWVKRTLRIGVDRCDSEDCNRAGLDGGVQEFARKRDRETRGEREKESVKQSDDSIQGIVANSHGLVCRAASSAATAPNGERGERLQDSWEWCSAEEAWRRCSMWRRRCCSVKDIQRASRWANG